MREGPGLIKVGLNEVADGAEAALERRRQIGGRGRGGRGRRRRRQVEPELELVQPVRQRVAVSFRGRDGRVGVWNKVSERSKIAQTF